MDDLMAGIGSPKGMNDINDLNELARQAEQEVQGISAAESHNTAVNASQQAMEHGSLRSSYGQQSTGYGAPQNSYGQQSAGYGAAPNSSAQRSTGYGAPQNSYGQQSTGYGAAPNSSVQRSTGYGAPQNSYGQQSTGYGNPQGGYGQRSAADSNNTPQYSPTPDFYASYDDTATMETDFMVLVKGALGAIIGALPGFFFIMMLARFGIIASICGTVLAAGTFFGYYIATKKSSFDLKKGGIVCIAVMVIAIFLAVRISWTYKLRDSLKMLKELSYSYIDESDLYNDSDKDNIDTSYKFLFGVDEPTYSNCSANFSKILTNLDLKGKFYGSLGENYLFCALGALWLFSKFGKKDY